MESSPSHPRRPRFSGSLFDGRPGVDSEDPGVRVRAFARAVARRHGRRRADAATMLVALRGYYRTWAVCSGQRLPALDEALVAVALQAYADACGAPGRLGATGG